MQFIISLICLSFFSLPSQANSPKSDHFNGQNFFNPELKDERTFWDVIKWKWTSEPAQWETAVANKAYPAPVLTAQNAGLVTFINHSTFLIQLQGISILTDPIFAERASPFSFMGPKRVRPPGLNLEQLPAIDVVIISHNHYDHLDIESLKKLDGKFHPLFLVPLGDEKLLKEAGIQNVIQLDWWQEFKVRETRIIMTPAQHWSARSFFDRNKSLWGGYWIDNPKMKIFFAGDTGYSSHFKQIREKFGSPDLALLPIGGYEPRWFMQGHHINPEEAVTVHRELGPRQSIGMHFGTFQLSDEDREQPIAELEIARTKSDIDPEEFMVLDHGETKSF